MNKSEEKTQSASMIRIYPSFTEVRQNINPISPHKVYFPEDLYRQIKPGSINLEGVKLNAMNSVLRKNNLEGKVVHINKDKETRAVKMIRSRDSLVQDLVTLRYFHVNSSNIEFTEIPEETGTEVTFKLEKDGPAILSYLMYGITWEPRYTLNINGDTNVFQGWADITNNTLKEYSIEKTELFGGDVSIRKTYRPQERFNMIHTMEVKTCDAPHVKAEGEIAGLYMYSISDGYILEPSSTFGLPFVSPTIELKKVALLKCYFSAWNTKGQSERIYKIKSNEFLPKGPVTVREDGRVVGQSDLPDLTADENSDLNVGNDSEVTYDREVELLRSDENQSEYEVTVMINNKKARIMNVKFIEHFLGRFEINCIENNVVVQNDYVQFERAIDAKSTASFNYTVLFCHKE